MGGLSKGKGAGGWADAAGEWKLDSTTPPSGPGPHKVRHHGLAWCERLRLRSGGIHCPETSKKKTLLPLHKGRRPDRAFILASLSSQEIQSGTSTAISPSKSSNHPFASVTFGIDAATSATDKQQGNPESTTTRVLVSLAMTVHMFAMPNGLVSHRRATHDGGLPAPTESPSALR